MPRGDHSIMLQSKRLRRTREGGSGVERSCLGTEVSLPSPLPLSCFCLFRFCFCFYSLRCPAELPLSLLYLGLQARDQGKALSFKTRQNPLGFCSDFSLESRGWCERQLVQGRGVAMSLSCFPWRKRACKCALPVVLLSDARIFSILIKRLHHHAHVLVVIGNHLHLPLHPCKS